MPQLLLEFFSEEIPARMQKRAEEDLARALAEKLKGAGLDAKAVKTFSSPRRIGAVIDDLPGKAADVNEERKGPRVGAPDQAVQGFLKGAGLKSIDEAQIVEDKKGAFYVAKIERAGRETGAIVQEIVPEIVRAFPWPKSMRSGSGDLTWVRPLHNICCVFDGKAVKIEVEVEGVGSEAVTWGHRFHAPEAMPVTSASDHASKLRGAKVLIEREERKTIILEQAKKLCAARGLELVDDVGLLEEVAGLVEWPVVLLGDMDPAFLDLPSEVIRLSMRTHQKYFAVQDPAAGGLAPHFIVVANIEASDGGAAIAAGNARVLSARLNDARYFWDVDRYSDSQNENRKKRSLVSPERIAKLDQLVFHQKLGSVLSKARRVGALASELCSVTGADERLVREAGELSKMDLVTETVGEFPELQGRVGRQLYRFENGLYVAMPGPGGFKNQVGAPKTFQESNANAIKVADAIEDHYLPTGPDSKLPRNDVGYTLALADKIDTLSGFWAINEKPTGSGDPYALRRAALGVIRIAEEGRYRFSVRTWVLRAFEIFVSHWSSTRGPVLPLNYWKVPLPDEKGQPGRETLTMLKFASDGDWSYSHDQVGELLGFFGVIGALEARKDETVDEDHRLEVMTLNALEVAAGVSAFLADRLKVQLRDQGKRHDLVDAVFALGDDDLVRIVARVEALDAFLKTEDGSNLLAGYKRAANILAAEEKKGKWSADEATGEVDAKLLAEPAEKALHEALKQALPAARAAVEREEFAAAMKALSGLRAPVDAFFDKVLVNAPEEQVRRNRLLLLSRFREALSAVADFSKIEG